MKRTLISPTLFLTTAVFTLTVSFASASQVVYRWKDAQGNQVNSDRPPPAGVEYETISGTSNFMYPEAAEQERPADEEKPAATQQPEVAKSQTRPMLEKNPEYCDQARKNLEVLSTRARIRVPDGNGSYRYIDEDEKAEQRATAEAIIAQHCK